MNSNTMLWMKAAGTRAIRTVAQAALASIGTAACVGAVDWKMVASSSLLAGLISLLMSIKGLPEVNAEGSPEAE